MSISLHAPAPPEPLEEVLKHYTDTLCTAQKQTNFTNTLMQDIIIFNGSDATQLENWLVDIETATDLSAESWSKLAQAKSNGLAHTLITEALTSGKCWDAIKDLLHLKICNSDIHTSKSHFMGKYSRKRRNLSQHIFIASKEKPKDVTLPIVLPQLEYLLRDSEILMH